MPNRALRSLRRLADGIWIRKREISHVSILGYAILTVTFMLQVAIARLLGAEGFGTYAANLAMIALIEVPLVVRGGEVAMRTLGESWRKRDGNLSALAQAMIRYDLRLFLSTFLLLALAAWGLHTTLGLNPLLFTILALMIPSQAGLGVFKSYFTIFDKVPELVRFEFVYAILLATLNLTGLMLWGVYGLAASMVVATLTKTYLAYRYTRKYLPDTERVPVDSRAPALTRDGMLSIVRNLFANGLNQIDVILLGALQKPEAVALYKVGKSLASLPIKIAFPVWRYLQPRLMEAVQTGNRAGERRAVLAGSAVLILVMVCLMPLILWFGEAALVFLYGAEYREAFRYFLILLAGVWAFHGIAGWFKFWVVVTDAQLYGIAVYAIAFAAVTVLAATIGASSPVAMAYTVSSVLVGMSAVAFTRVFRP